jgi:ABC-2 type transport system permease protein
VNKTWQIIKREYFTRVRKKSFILFTVLGPLFFVLIGILPILISNIGQQSQKILVKDDSGLLNALPDTAGMYFIFNHADKSLDELKYSFSKLDDGYDALLYLPKGMNPITPYGVEIYGTEQISITTRSYIENIIADKLEEINLDAQHLDKQEIIKLRPKITIDDKVTSGKEEKQGDAVVASVFGYAMGFIIYIVLLIYGMMVMRGVMEEKTSRIIEVIISSVRPFQLMIGKIVGIGFVGLTQFVVWGFLIFILQFVVAAVFSSQFAELQTMSATSGGGDSDLFTMAQAYQSLSEHPIIYYIFIFLIYFLGGYFMYAALFAAIGSLASDDDTDTQMYSLPVTMLIITSIFIMMTVVQQPHTKLAFWASIIPFSSPIVMPAIIPFEPPVWQIVLSILCLIGGFFFTTFLASRIYRVGILMYGKKIKFREVIKWMFYKG